MTEVYVFDRGEETLSEELLCRLPPWRQERTARLKNAIARQESLAVGLLWCYGVEKRGWSRAEPVSLCSAGKPVFSKSAVHFSLSHSGRYAMCALSEERVGVDVQELRQVKPSMARWLHPQERQWLESWPPERQTEAFFRLWTRKEAWVKAESGERMLSLGETDVIHPLPGYEFMEYALPFGCRAAVCARERIPAEPVFVTREELLRQWR